MTILNVDKQIQQILQKRERSYAQRIGWISLCVGVLYVCGYTWRLFYYKTLGIPPSIIDYPFPEILVPKPGVLAFMFGFVYFLLFLLHVQFCRRYRIAKVTEMLGTELPTDQVFDYLKKRNVNSGRVFNRKMNVQVFRETLEKYINACSEEKSKSPFDADGFQKLFPDATEKMRQSILSYYRSLLPMSKEDVIKTVRSSMGLPPKGSTIFYLVSYAIFSLSILIPIFFLYYGRFLVLPWVLGVNAGMLLGYMLYSEDRFQTWFVIACTIVLALIGTGISAKQISNLDLITRRFPLAKVFLSDKRVKSGFILGKFSDSYVMMPFDRDEAGKRISIKASQIISMNLIYPNTETNNTKVDEGRIQKLLNDI